jgi:hypothetical protein
MTFDDFKALVTANSDWFKGVHPETKESLLAAEQALGEFLPSSLKWLLSEWGYSNACGVASLDEVVVTTLRCRQTGFSKHFIILNDWGDAGVVILNAVSADPDDERPVLWTATHNIQRLAKGEDMDGDVMIFPDFPEWVASRLDDAQQESGVDSDC